MDSEQASDSQAFEAAFGGNDIPADSLAPNQVMEKLQEIARGFRIVSIKYNCGVPDCPEHEGTAEEFLQHAMVTVMMLGMQLGATEMAVAGAAQDQVRSGSGPLASMFGL